MIKESECENRMCKKINELNGLTSQTVLNKYWKKKEYPIDIAQILYEMNIKVSAFDFSKAEALAGVPSGDILGAVLTYGDNVAIVYKKGDSLNRIRFTLAHELAHCCLSHIKPDANGYIEFRRQQSFNDEHEIAANIFAGELLIPENALSGVLATYFKNSFPASEFLAKFFAVSVNVMEERLKHLKIPFIDKSNMKVVIFD